MSESVVLIRNVIAQWKAHGRSESEIALTLGCDIDAVHAILGPCFDAQAAENLLRSVPALRRAVASEAITKLCKLGLQQKTVALDLGKNPGTISRGHNDPDWALSPDLVMGLLARLEREPEVPIKVIDTCPAPGAVVGAEAGEGLKSAFRAALRSVLIGSSEPPDLPNNILGALAEFGGTEPSFYAVLVSPRPACFSGPAGPLPALDSDDGRSIEARQIEILIHELTDLIRRLQGRVDSLRGDQYRPEGAF